MNFVGIKVVARFSATAHRSQFVRYGITYVKNRSNFQACRRIFAVINSHIKLERYPFAFDFCRVIMR